MSCYLVFVRANQRLAVVVREESILESEIAGLPAREVLALLHEMTLPCHTRCGTRHKNKTRRATRASGVNGVKSAQPVQFVKSGTHTNAPGYVGYGETYIKQGTTWANETCLSRQVGQNAY